ncbi:NAD-dependent succinate-semialdehyde dehydrogenase [Sporosarcina sp. 179-K 3D1 HS]|uniref:NAD-dependent succinate-semialdehyde dehydrogenase n=1 Tax=Sporosarcina sp. 179-K 3D1 HS TaxID=3232169 RepID=UPI0039A16528
MYINGEWIQTDNKLRVYSPATGECTYEVSNGTGEHVQKAIDAADEAFKTWSKTPAIDRANYLIDVYRKMEEKKEFLAEVITKEMGKPIIDARGEVQSSIEYFRWFAEEARRVYGETVPSNSYDKRILVIKQPIGVVGAITPWNFPLSMVARKAGPALAAGCTLVIKPSSKSPQSTIELAKIFEEVGLPKGVFNVVMANSSEVTEVLMDSSKVKKITFTGSTNVGKLLMEKSAKTVKHISMELGGHAPFIVFEDANIEQAARDLLSTKFRCSGQMCTSTNRIYVQDTIAANFTELLVNKVRDLKVGNGLDEETNVGPLIDQNAVAKVKEQIEDAVSKGALKIENESELSEEEAQGNFVNPTILTNVSPEMNIYTEESFGPVAPIITFQTEEELMKMVNHEKYGLASYLYTDNMSRVIRVSEALDYGMVGVNDPLPFVVQSPFGGFKESGIGKEGGHQGLEAYLVEKLVAIKYNA